MYVVFNVEAAKETHFPMHMTNFVPRGHFGAKYLEGLGH